MAQGLQLRNDICNEPTWEAVFSDQEVNAWLAEDLVSHFADQLPPEVHEPRVLFELDRIILAFQLASAVVQSVITVVARPRVPEGNTVELTLEKIRAGILPVPADNVLDRIVEYARYHGLDVEWTRRDGYPVVLIRYTPNLERDDVQLEEVQIRAGQLRLAGRSDRTRGAFLRPRLPSRRVLQSKFPRRKVHETPSFRTDLADLHLADELSARPGGRGPGPASRSTSCKPPDRPGTRSPGPPRPRPRSPGRSADDPAAREPAGRRRPRPAASIAQVRSMSPCSSMKSQWTPFQRCSSNTNAASPDIGRSSPGHLVSSVTRRAPA